MLASKVAIALGAIALASLLLGILSFDPVVMMAGVIALIGGIVMFGSNASTAQQMAANMARAEAYRATLIDTLELRRVDDAKPQLTS
jgi:hypothetical protein